MAPPDKELPLCPDLSCLLLLAVWRLKISGGREGLGTWLTETVCGHTPRLNTYLHSGEPGNEASHAPWLNACSCIYTPLQIEVHLSCNLSTRQRRLYHGLRQRISIEDLLQSSTSQTASKDSSASHLLNLVMQFRKVREEEGSLCSLGLTRAIVLSPQVCNHPDLFERRDVKSPTFLPIPSFSIPQLLYHEALKLPVDRQR